MRFRTSARVRAYRSAIYHAAWLFPLMAVIGVASVQPPILTQVRNQLFDIYQRRRPLRWDATAPVRIVDVDEDSIAKLGQWPWPRTRIATLVARLRDGKAAAIGFDIVFSEADRTSPEHILEDLPDGPKKVNLGALLADIGSNDAALADALSVSPVALGLVLTQEKPLPAFPAPYGFATAGDDPGASIPRFSGAVAPLPLLAEKAAGLGFLNWLPDSDQIVRRVPLILDVGDHRVPSLAMEMLRVAQGVSTFIVRSSTASGGSRFSGRIGVDAVRIGEAQVSTEADGALRIHYSPHEPGRFLPAWKVLAGMIEPEAVTGRLVLVGSSAAGLNDVRATPIEAAVPGVEIQAQTLETLMANTALLRPDWAAPFEMTTAAIFAIGLALALPILPVLAGGTLAILATGGIMIASWIAFASYQLLLDPLVVAAALGAVYLGSTAVLFRAEQRGRRFVQDAFGRFVSPDVVARLASNPENLVLGGEQRQLTVMFTDVRNFSAIAEQMSAPDLTRFMNSYLSPMSEIVLDSGGTVDKYIGDAIMAFWNAPLADVAHARHAASAALAMITSLPALNAMLAATFGESCSPIRCGIGLATGPCVVGNLGSRLRFDYSALGDDVNLASRLESATKVYGVDILAADATRALAPELAWIEVDIVEVAGRQSATRVFTLLGDEAYAAESVFTSQQKTHNLMLAYFRGTRFREAAELATMLKAVAPQVLSGVYDFYTSRCAAYLTEPPPVDWDTVTRLTQK